MAEINEDGIIVSNQSIYVPQTWIDEVDKCTPITAERMNYIERGISEVAERCDSLYQRAFPARVKCDLNRRIVSTNGAGTTINLRGEVPFGMSVSSIDVPSGTSIILVANGKTYNTTVTMASDVESTPGSFRCQLSCTTINHGVDYGIIAAIDARGKYVVLNLVPSA